MPWFRVCGIDELPRAESSANSEDGAGSQPHDECTTLGKEFVVDGRIIAIFAVERDFFAVDGMCAHQGGPIAKGQLHGNCVTCPWHGWQYDVTSGCNLLTGKQMLDTYPSEIRDGEFWIEID